MKKVGKPVFFIIAALIAVMGFLAVFGISETYGDITTDKVKSIDDIVWGLGFGGGSEMVLVPANGESVTEDELKEMRSIVMMRLDNLGISDVSIKIGNNALTVAFPWEDTGDYDRDDIIAKLCEKGTLTFREGAEYDETTGLPTGRTLENIIFSGDDVENAEPVYTTGDDGQTVCYVKLTLSKDARARFEDATTRLTGDIISIWMDDTLLAMQSVTNAVSDGTAFISGDMTAFQTISMSEKINAGDLPTALACDSVFDAAPAFGGGAKIILAAVFAAVIAAAAVFIAAKYKLAGFVGAVALIGQVVVIVAALTGFIPVIAAVPVNASSILGTVLAIAIGFYTLASELKFIAEKAATSRFAKDAVFGGAGKAAKSTAKLNIAAFIIGLVIMAAFYSAGGAASKLVLGLLSFTGKGAADIIYPFGHMLLWGVVGNVIMNICAFMLMLSSLSGFKKFSAFELYGKK